MAPAPEELLQPDDRIRVGRPSFFLLVGGINLLFLALGQFVPFPHPNWALFARGALSVGLLSGAVILSRPWPESRLDLAARWLGAVLGAALGLLVWATGGLEGPYGPFFAFAPLLFFIAVPDEPFAVLFCALSVMVSGALIADPDSQRYSLGLWLLQSGALSIYAVVGSFFQRAQIRRERAAHVEASMAQRRLTELERKRALEARLAILGRFVAGVAHELRNPLTVVSSNVSLLRDPRAAALVQTGEALRDVELGIERIRQLVEDLRGFARDEDDTPQPADLRPLVDDALRLAAVRLRGAAQVERSIPADLPMVLVRAQRVEQVLVNLLVNAADALEGNGAAGASGAAASRKLVRVSAVADGDFVRLSVEDNGTGLSPEIVPRLFEPFATTKGRRGTGLGLSLSREYLESFGGRIEVAPGTLGGARFVVSLPVAVEP